MTIGPEEKKASESLVGQVIGSYKVAERHRDSLVFLAFKEEAPDERVALKVFYPDPFAENEDLIWNRLHSIKSLNHENIVKVYDVGKRENFIYAVMEYVPGENLYDLMQRNPRLHWGVAAELAREIVRGLVAAHDKKILHLSLHPDRVLLGKGGQIKISFCNEGEITPSKEIVHYVAPELFLGKKLEECSDIYSLGAIIYNIVTGKPPLVGKKPREIALKHREHSAVLPKYGVADIPHSLSLILSRSMSIDPSLRYRHGFEVQAAFNNFLVNDIGHYILESYKELLPKVVEVSEQDKEFTRKIRIYTGGESQEAVIEEEESTDETTDENINNELAYSGIHSSRRICPKGVTMKIVVWCMLSLLINVIIALWIFTRLKQG